MDNVYDFTTGSVAFGKAGLDKNFTLFKIYTRPLKDAKTGEVGQFHVDCTYPLEVFEQMQDKVGFLKRLARAYLWNNIQGTGVPLESWIVEFSPIMERYQIPSHLFLDTGRDRAWLV